MRVDEEGKISKCTQRRVDRYDGAHIETWFSHRVDYGGGFIRANVRGTNRGWSMRTRGE